MTIFVTAQGWADHEAAMKAAKPGKGTPVPPAAGQERDGGPLTGAHAMAEGARRVLDGGPEHPGDGDGEHPEDLEEQEGREERRGELGAAKAVTDCGAVPFGGQRMEPGSIAPGDFRRPYLSGGHAAASPGHFPPVAHVDLSGSRGALMPVSPGAAMPPAGGR